MSEKIEKAFQDWWATAAVTSSPRETFFAGWRATENQKIGHTTLLMTTEQEAAFLKLGSLGDDELFLAGWNAALENRRNDVAAVRLVARQNERHETRERIVAIAVKAFLDGHYETARNHLEFANELFGKLP